MTRFYPVAVLCFFFTFIGSLASYADTSPNAGSDFVTCTDTAKLSGNTPTDGWVGRWSVLEGTGGTGVFDNEFDPNTTVRNLKENLNVFVWSFTKGGDSLGDIVSVNHYIPTQALAGADICVAADSAQLGGNTFTGGTESGLWTAVTPGVTFSNSASRTSKANFSAPGIYQLEWQINRNGCISRDTVVVTSITKPGTGAALCLPYIGGGASETLTGNPPNNTAGESGIWSTGAPQVSFTAATQPNSNVNISAPGTYTLFWKISNNGCADSSALTVRAVTMPDAGANICQKVGDTLPVLNATVPTTGEIGRWSSKPSGITFVDSTSASTALSAFSAGNYILQWKISNGACSFNDSLTAIKVTGPNAGPDTALAFPYIGKFPLSAIAANATRKENGFWELKASLNAVIERVDTAHTFLNGLDVQQQAHKVAWTITDSTNKCIMVDEKIISVITSPNAGPDQCLKYSGTTIPATLSGNPPATGETGEWQVVPGFPSVTFTNPTLPNTPVSGLTPGIYRLSWTIKNNTYGSLSSIVTLRVVSEPEAGSTICRMFPATNATLTGATVYGSTPAAGEKRAWTKALGSPATISFPDSLSTPVSNINVNGPQTFYFHLSSSDSVCTFTDSVRVRRLSAPNAGADTCITGIGFQTANLKASLPDSSISETGIWTPVSSSSISISNQGSHLTQVSQLDTKTHSYTWTISQGTCSFRDTVAVIVTTPPNAGTNRCVPYEGTPFNLPLTGNPANASVGESSLWEAITTGAPTPANTGLASTSLSMTKGSYEYRYSIINGACRASDTVRLTAVTKPNAGTDTCIPISGSSINVPLKANPVDGVIEKGNWDFSRPVASTFTYESINVTMPKGKTSGYWIIKNEVSGCTFADTVDVRVITQSQIENPIVCEQFPVDTAQLKALAIPVDSLGETGIWTANSLTADVSNRFLPETNAFNLEIGKHFFRWEISMDTFCTSESEKVVTILTKPSVSAGQCHVFSGTPLPSISITSATTLASGESGIWRRILNTAASLPSDSTPSTVLISNLLPGTHTFTRTISSGSCSVSDTTTIRVIDKANAGPDSCVRTPVANISLKANKITSGSGAIGLWTVLPVPITTARVDSLRRNEDSTRITGLMTGINRFQWQISLDSSCFSRDTIDVRRLTAANAGIDTATCGKEFTLYANTPAGPGETGKWSVVQGKGIFSSESNPGAKVDSLRPYINRLSWTISQGGCAFSDTIEIINKQPETVDAGLDNNQWCQTTYTTAANNPKLEIPTATGTWNIVSQPVANDDKLLIDSLTKPNAFIRNVDVIGDYVFTWQIQNSNCTAITDTLKIARVTKVPVFAGNDTIICSDEFLLNATLPKEGAIGEWSGSGVTFDEVDKNITWVRGLDASIVYNNLSWTITDGACVSDASVRITRYLEPTKAKIKPISALCASDSTLVLADPVNRGRGRWSVSDSLISFDTAGTTIKLKNLPYDSSRVIFTTTNGVCPPSSDTAYVERFEPVNFSPVPAKDSTTICATQEDLIAPLPNVGTGVWTSYGSTGVIEDSLDNITIVEDLTAGNHVFKWEVTNGACTDSLIRIIHVIKPLTVPNAGKDTVVCADTLTLYAALPGTDWGRWGAVEPGRSPVFVNIANPRTRISDIPYNTVRLYWEVYAPNCPSLYDTITIVNNTPSPARAMRDETICSDEVLLDAELPVNGTGVWKLEAGAGIFDNSFDTATLIRQLGPDTNLLSWNVENAGCDTSKAFVKIINQSVNTPQLGPTMYLCDADTVLLKTNNPDKGIAAWGDFGALMFVPANDTSGVIRNLQADTNIIRRVHTYESCSTEARMLIINYMKPSKAVAGEMMETFMDHVSLNASAPEVGKGMWTAERSGDILSPNSPLTEVKNLPPGDNYFIWTVSNGVCAPEADRVLVKVNSFFIPNGFSPNGDGVNDFFVINGLEELKGGSIKIYDRLGMQVFNSGDYKNDWDGTSGNGKSLADDTYFYLLELANGTKYNGYVMLRR